ncbi:MAG TPA: hypothetical protein VLV83_07540 [Acidobacteriota bacterium]|nr:hypothetical protein [Acidobacteriota bacterium]
MRLLRSLPAFSASRFHPQKMVEAVNVLYDCGFEGSLEILREHCTREISAEVGCSTQDLFAVTRLLFVPEEGGAGFPDARLGRPEPALPQDPGLLPLFPLHVHGGIPFLLTTGYLMGGQAMPPMAFLDACRSRCRLRQAPLQPDDHPFQLVDEFLESTAWKTLDAPFRLPFLVRLQALRAISRICPISEKVRQGLLSGPSPGDIWLERRRAVARLPIVWDASTNQYQLAG